MSNFKEQRSRYGTYSTQWDYVQDRFGEKGLLPFSISDMDFMIPDGTKEVLAKAVTRGFGYTRWNHLDYKQSISHWFCRNLIVRLIQTGVSTRQVSFIAYLFASNY